MVKNYPCTKVLSKKYEKINYFDPIEKSITRRFLTDDKFRRIHDQWSMENEQLLETHKDDWNFGIIIRNHTRDFMDKMIERILEIENIKK